MANMNKLALMQIVSAPPAAHLFYGSRNIYSTALPTMAYEHTEDNLVRDWWLQCLDHVVGIDDARKHHSQGGSRGYNLFQRQEYVDTYQQKIFQCLQMVRGI